MATQRASTVGGSDYTSGSLREDLANFITLVSAEKTPHLSMLGTNKATNPKHEWQTDTLSDPADNVGSGSATYTSGDGTADAPDRIDNYTQVFTKATTVEGSLERSNPAGAKNWFQYSINKRKIEMRRDIERKHLFYNDFTVSGNVVKDASGTARKMGGLAAYAGIVNSASTASIELNAASGTGTAITGQTAGTAFSTLAITNAAEGSHVVQAQAAVTDATLTLPMIQSLERVAHDNGGMFNTVQIPTGMKRAVTKLLIDGDGGAAQRRADAMSKRLNIMVDSVLTEYNDLALVNNYIMQGFAGDASSAMFFYDSSMINRTVLQPYDMEVDGTARYGKGALLFCEETVEVRAPNSLGIIFGITG